MVDDQLRACDEGAREPESLATGGSRGEDLIANTEAVYEACTRLSIDTCGVGFVDDEEASISGGDLRDAIERSHVSVHTEQGLHQDESSTLLMRFGKAGFKSFQIEMRKNDSFGARESQTVDQARVIELIGEYAVVSADEAR